MQTRELGKSGLRVSQIGLGCEHLEGKPYATVAKTIDAALDAGINVFDVFMSEPDVRSHIGRALLGRRNNVYIQGHFRAIWKDGQYGRTTEVEACRRAFEDLLIRLRTDYIDFGMLHLIDNEEDYQAVFCGGIMEYARRLREAGVVRFIGASSHNPAIAQKMVQSGEIDVLLFSLNAAYDLLDADAPPAHRMGSDFLQKFDIHGISAARSELYQACAQRGIGITAMKALGAGLLLNAKRSPFGKAMTVAQCVQYALDRPAVASVMLGMQSPVEVREAVRYGRTDASGRDYTGVLSSQPAFNLRGHCVYCNHCLPCPQHIDIAQVNKYLDLAWVSGAVSPSLAGHYAGLAHKAGDCVRCGACERRCPFEVEIQTRMRQAKEQFGS